MRLRAVATPIVLIVMAGGAAAYALLVDRGRVSDADRAARRRDAFPSFRVEDVTRVELTHGSETLVLARDTNADAGAQGSSWTMMLPRVEPADPGAVDVLLRELDQAERVRDVDPEVATGLDAPRAGGTLSLGALTYRFALGGEAPRPEGASYMRVDGEGTFVVGRTVTTQLLRSADAYRQHALMRVLASEVERVEVRGGSTEGFVLERHGPTFRLSGDGRRAGRADVDRLFGTLAEAQAEAFLGDGDADRALGAGAITVVVTSQDAVAPVVELRVGGACPTIPGDLVAVRVRPSRVSCCVARSLGDALGTNRDALVDRSPLFARADEIEALRLEGGTGGPRVDIARKGSGWRERAPEDRDLTADESKSASALVAAIAGARATEVQARRAITASGPPPARATVTRTGSSTTELLELGAPEPDGSAWMTRGDDGARLLLPRATARRFEPHPIALRSGAMWDTPMDPATIVGIDDTCGPAPEHLAWNGSTWDLRAPTESPPDANAVDDLTSALARTHVVTWVTEMDDGTFGLHGADACHLAMTVSNADGGTRTTGVLFGAATEGGFFARCGDDPAIFVAPSTLRALATHPVIDRRRFVIDPSTLGALVMTRGGAQRVAQLDMNPPDPLVDAAAGLVVVAAVHAGAARPGEGVDPPTLELRAVPRASAGATLETRLALGAATQIDGIDGYFARAAGVDATFVLRKEGVAALIAAAAATPASDR